LVDAEGVVHEAFMTMLVSRTPIHNPPAWLFTVARRLVGKIAAQRERVIDGNPAELVDISTVRWSSLAPQASAEDVSEVRRAFDGIARLSEHQKAAVYLRHVQGWTHAEIGEYLQCATATAGVHVHRGTTRLQHWLDRAGRTAFVVVAVSLALAAFTLGSPLLMYAPAECGTPTHGDCAPQPGLPPWLGVVLVVVIVVAAALVALATRWAVRTWRRNPRVESAILRDREPGSATAQPVTDHPEPPCQPETRAEQAG
jgi:RNA polymerase sigma factor (sigma-70 family)